MVGDLSLDWVAIRAATEIDRIRRGASSSPDRIDEFRDYVMNKIPQEPYDESKVCEVFLSDDEYKVFLEVLEITPGKKERGYTTRDGLEELSRKMRLLWQDLRDVHSLNEESQVELVKFCSEFARLTCVYSAGSGYRRFAA